MAKGGFRGMPGGMNQASMLKQAQKMQQDMMRMQQELQEKEYEAAAGGGVVTATVTGKRELKEVVIAPEAVDPEDVEMLQDMIVAAVNEALRAAESDSASTMQQLTGRSTYDKLAVKLTDMETDIPQEEAVSSALDRANNTPDGYIVNNLLSQKAQLDDILSIVTTALSLVAGISLAVSGISIMTTMLMSVTERTREIGIKRSIGATSFDICREFLAESVLLTILGSAAGTAAGLLISGIGCVIAGVPFQVNLAMIGIAALASGAVGALFGAYPAYKAASLDPVEALRM